MLLIYLPAITPRTEYVFDLVFKNVCGIEYATTTDLKIFQDHAGEKLGYSSATTGTEFFIKASLLLFETTIEEKNISVERKQEMPVLFLNDPSCDVGFDIFAAVFYMVSRYEEYLPFSPDKHGRFRAADSLAYKQGFLQYPVVNIWINHFKNKLSERFGALPFATSTFKTIVTYDIDIAYAFRGRSLLRLMGSTVKDLLTLKFKNIGSRIKALSAKNDPWDVYDPLMDSIERNHLKTIFFFLLGDYSRYDKNVKHEHPLMTGLIKKLAAFTDIGIHPSYKSSVIPGKISIEKRRLEQIAGKEIIKSRQHYLRFKLPGTYNELLNAGIKEDYSMGFTDMPGFRAGTCTPFYFYDLENEKKTELLVFPVTFMEGTFIEYLKISPFKAWENINSLIENIKKVNGTFISIWHNNTISDHGIYRGWKDVHDKMIQGLAETVKQI